MSSGRYSLTIQVDPSLPGHVALAVNDPSFSPPNNIFSPGRPASFDDRFGNGTPSAKTGVQPGSNQPAPSSQSRSSTPTDPRDIRVLRRVTPNTGVPSPLAAQNQPPRPTKLPGLFTGQPMPEYLVPPMLFGLPDSSTASTDNMDDWFSRWIKPLLQQ